MSNLKDLLLHEFSHNIRGGIYSYVQKALAYHSNKIEGSTLTEEHTESLFETGLLYADDTTFKAKDIEEAQGHFMMFNYMLKTLEQPLSIELIKQFHLQLKQGVFEDRANGYAIGDFKKRPNRVGNVTTAKPDEVQNKMEELIANYTMSDKTIDTLLDFHVKFETIHPFQDGNGRVGRLILFRECLKNNIIPIIIKYEFKQKYNVTIICSI